MPTNYEYGQMDSVAQARQQGTAEASAYLRNVEQRLRHGELARLNLRLSSSVTVNMDVAKALISLAELGEGRRDAERFDGETEAIHERLEKTGGTQIGETEATASQVPSGVALF